jgi:flagellar biosynthetic protein FliP
MARKGVYFLLAALALLASGLAWSQNLPMVTATPSGRGTVYAVPVQTLLSLTALTFLPAALMLMTSFTRILIVFSLLRQALGLQSMPPNMVLIGLSLFLTALIMNPVFTAMYNEAYLPLVAGNIGFETAVTKAAEPLRQ